MAKMPKKPGKSDPKSDDKGGKKMPPAFMKGKGKGK